MYSAIKICDFSRRSGGIDGRPTLLYIASNVSDNPARISSAIVLMRRSGWSAGIRFSGETTENIEACLSSAPRMLRTYPEPITESIPDWGFSAAC